MARAAIELDARVGLEGATDDGDVLRLDGLPGAFDLHYQPEVDLRTGQVTACEALLRWWHPDFGLLRPGASLHRSRWAGRLAGLDRWAVHAACRQVATWSDAGRPLQVALNVTRRSLMDPAFRRTVVDALAVWDIDPALLGVDVPLASFAMHPVATARTATTLADVGVTIIADGVAGEMSAETLTESAVSVVKVRLAMARVRNGGVHPSVAETLALTHEVGATAVAKAVETDEQLEMVRSMGFDRAFGHLLGDAMERPAFTEFVAEH